MMDCKEHFISLIEKMRYAQKMAFMKSKFERDKKDWIQHAHRLEIEVDNLLKQMTQ